MDLDYILYDALNKALISERIKGIPNSNKIAKFVSNYLKNMPNTEAMKYDTVLTAVFSKCKEGSIVAFKSKENEEWYTGYIQSLFEPNSKYNTNNVWSVSICVYLPIEPQWYHDNDKTIYSYKDITNAILLENGS